MKDSEATSTNEISASETTRAPIKNERSAKKNLGGFDGWRFVSRAIRKLLILQ